MLTAKKNGNNRYAHSAIRQFLNSDKPAGQWWASQHQYDVAPDYATTKDGFMRGLDPDFLTVIGKTKISVIKHDVDGGGYEDLEDCFYLSSRTEIGLGNQNDIAEGANFPYFNSDDRRIKLYDGNESDYVLRTPSINHTYAVCSVHPYNSMILIATYYPGRIVPFCNII